MSTQIDFSPGESAILGLKTGRCNTDFFDAQILYKQIIENEYDICRLKVPAEDELASCRLNNIGLPFFFSGSIRRYKTRISEKPSGEYNFPDLIFEMYDGTQDQLLRDMLIGTWGTYPIGYYRSPYLESIVTRQKEIECVFQFYKKYNLNKSFPNNRIMFIKHGDAYVGFFALNVIAGNLESHIGGILEPYRKSGYFLDKLRYIKEFTLQHNLEYFIFGARNENAEVQRIFQFVGFHAIGSENVFHIPSLLTFSQKPPVIEELNLEINNPLEFYQKVMSMAQAQANHIQPRHTSISFQLNGLRSLDRQKHMRLKFSFPVLTSNELLVVIKDVEQSVSPFIGYFKAIK